jgi:hypothetical protein
MRQAYHAESALQAEGLLTELAAELDKTHPGAAASLREGMTETLTILRLGVPPTLARTLHSTNPIVILSSRNDHGCGLGGCVVDGVADASAWPLRGGVQRGRIVIEERRDAAVWRGW